MVQREEEEFSHPRCDYFNEEGLTENIFILKDLLKMFSREDSLKTFSWEDSLKTFSWGGVMEKTD